MLQACDESSSGRCIPSSSTRTWCSRARRFRRSSRYVPTLSRENGWGELRDTRVFPDKAAETKFIGFPAGRGNQAIEAEVAERIRADFSADLFDGEICGDELFVRCHVDAEITRIENRR